MKKTSSKGTSERPGGFQASDAKKLFEDLTKVHRCHFSPFFHLFRRWFPGLTTTDIVFYGHLVNLGSWDKTQKSKDLYFSVSLRQAARLLGYTHHRHLHDSVQRLSALTLIRVKKTETGRLSVCMASATHVISCADRQLFVREEEDLQVSLGIEIEEDFAAEDGAPSNHFIENAIGKLVTPVTTCGDSSNQKAVTPVTTKQNLWETAVTTCGDYSNHPPVTTVTANGDYSNRIRCLQSPQTKGNPSNKIKQVKPPHIKSRELGNASLANARCAAEEVASLPASVNPGNLPSGNQKSEIAKSGNQEKETDTASQEVGLGSGSEGETSREFRANRSQVFSSNEIKSTIAPRRFGLSAGVVVEEDAMDTPEELPGLPVTMPAGKESPKAVSGDADVTARQPEASGQMLNVLSKEYQTRGLKKKKGLKPGARSNQLDGRSKKSKANSAAARAYEAFAKVCATHGIAASSQIPAQDVRFTNDFVDRYGLDEIEDMVKFVVENWDQLRATDHKLLPEPTWNQIVVSWRYEPWMQMTKESKTAQEQQAQSADSQGNVDWL